MNSSVSYEPAGDHLRGYQRGRLRLDDAEPAKQQIARALLGVRPRPGTSPQVLRELYVVACSKLGLSTEQAAAAVRALVPTVAVVEDAALVLLAVGAAQRWQLSLWHLFAAS